MSNKTVSDSGFDATLRCKVPGSLVERLQRIAAAKVKKNHELYREAVVEFVERAERELDLPPIDSAKEQA